MIHNVITAALHTVCKTGVLADGVETAKESHRKIQSWTTDLLVGTKVTETIMNKIMQPNFIKLYTTPPKSKGNDS